MVCEGDPTLEKRLEASDKGALMHAEGGGGEVVDKHIEDNEESVLVAIVLLLFEDVVDQLGNNQTHDLEMADNLRLWEHLLTGLDDSDQDEEPHAQHIKPTCQLSVLVQVLALDCIPGVRVGVGEDEVEHGQEEPERVCFIGH